MTRSSLFVVLVMALAACGGKIPETRYYQLSTPGAGAARSGDSVLVLETLQTDAAYDDERIVYRTNPYRLDYYNFHRWSAAPGTLIGNYLEQAFERTGQFRAVVRDMVPNAAVVLAGRVVAIEEVDTTTTAWTGRIVVELSLTDAKSGESLWSEQLEELEPLPARNPEGLARALSTAMARIAARAAPIVAKHADTQAALHADQPTQVGRAQLNKGR